MNWEKARKDNESIIIPDSWLYIHYYEALNILFRLENALRMFVYIILKNEFKDKWLDINIISDDNQENTIRTISKIRKKQADNYGYIGYAVTCPIMYLTSGELINIIMSDSFWKHFKNYFKGKKEIIQAKLDEIGHIRNALAHFRAISTDDVDVVIQNSKQVFKSIDETLHQLMDIFNTVPTNTDEAWYDALKDIKNKYIRIKLLQSDDAKWIRIEIEFISTIMQSSSINHEDRPCYYKALKLNTPKILELYNKLSSIVTYIAENTPYIVKDNPNFNKRINFVFKKEMLASNYLEIKEQLWLLCDKICEEVELIKQDNLAKGSLIEMASVSVYKENIIAENLCCKIAPNDPPEYWGTVYLFVDEAIPTINRYPWMQVDISEQVFP